MPGEGGGAYRRGRGAPSPGLRSRLAERPAPLSAARPLAPFRQPRRLHLAPAMPEQLRSPRVPWPSRQRTPSPGRAPLAAKMPRVPWGSPGAGGGEKRAAWRVWARQGLSYLQAPGAVTVLTAPRNLPFKSLRTEWYPNIWVLPSECLGRRARIHLGGSSHLDDRLPRLRDIPTML